MKILVTGGAGYIGTHTLLQLLIAKHEVMVVDDYSNSSPEALVRVKKLAGADFAVFEGDISNKELLDSVFCDFRPEAVIHFAGLKSVSDSNRDPLDYYSCNVSGSVELLRCMQRHNCSRLVFSSSATVYGEASYLPYDEDHPLKPTNPYGRTKYFIEEIIKDWVHSWAGSSAVLLRYFNPVGADSSGLIGEDPSGTPSNLLPYVSQVAVGQLDRLLVFGDDYDTRDGSGERDFIHVEDLARAHLAAIEYSKMNYGCEAFNIGTGKGATVFEVVAAFENASGRKVPFQRTSRREGDVASSIASVCKAERLLGWKAKLDIDNMCQTAWNWQVNNPRGYISKSV